MKYINVYKYQICVQDEDSIIVYRLSEAPEDVVE